MTRRNVLWEFLKGIYKLVKWCHITVGSSLYVGVGTGREQSTHDSEIKFFSSSVERSEATFVYIRVSPAGEQGLDSGKVSISSLVQGSCSTSCCLYVRIGPPGEQRFDGLMVAPLGSEMQGSVSTD